MSSSVSFAERMPKREMSEEQNVKSERADCRSFCRLKRKVSWSCCCSLLQRQEPTWMAGSLGESASETLVAEAMPLASSWPKVRSELSVSAKAIVL